mgnify:CR=1 FL=1
MAGNSSRKGAVRQSKKGPSAGTGGNNKRRLEGKGPTPKAEDRPYHAAAKRKKAAEKKETRSPRMPKGDRPRGEIVAGRNAVLEALRESVPATELLVARSIDVDDRVAESLQLALNLQLPIREVHRAEVIESTTKSFTQEIIFDTIVDAEQVSVNEQELTEYLFRASQRYGMSPDQFIKEVTDAGQVNTMIAEVARAKALAGVLGRVKIVTKSGKAVDLEALRPQPAVVESAE